MAAGRGRGRFCGTGTPEEIWRKIYGTDYYGNLPQHLQYTHVGHCWAPCPYSTQATELRTRHLLGLSDSDPLPTKVDHTGTDNKIYYLITENKGPIWGYECTFDNCPYYLTNGERYFYT